MPPRPTLSPPCLRVLVVEDEWLIADQIEATLRDAGHAVVGPAPTAAEALRILGERTVDAGLLDVRIRGGDSFPVARALGDRGLPFILMTGYLRQDLPPEFRDCALLGKPITTRPLLAALARLAPAA